MAWSDDVFATGHVATADLQQIEDNFAVIKALFASASAPANAVAGQPWIDTTNHIFKIRNEGNSAWISVWDLANDKPYGQDFADGSYLDGDKIDIDFNPSSYTPIATAEGDDVDDLAYHLKGIDDALADHETQLLTDSSVSQAKLKTTNGSVSASYTSYPNGRLVALPGGEYGFYPQLKTNYTIAAGEIKLADNTGSGTLGTSYASYIFLHPPNGYTFYARQRYVQSSGEVYWVFILKNKETGEIGAVWQAPDHPCMGNGGDPELMPHPFGDYDREVEELIVINPTDSEIKAIKRKTTSQKDFIDVLLGEFDIDEAREAQWPDKEVTVGLPDDWSDAWLDRTPVKPIKKKIPKPGYACCRRLKKKLK